MSINQASSFTAGASAMPLGHNINASSSSSSASASASVSASASSSNDIRSRSKGNADIPSASASASASVNASGLISTNTDTPLRSIRGKNGFEYPAIWSFPPFFTLQPNPSTLAHQLELWRALVLRWAKYERVFEVSVDGNELGEVFENKRIKRKLLTPSLRRLLTEMSKNGEAAPDPPKQDNRYSIYWKKPDEWADLIYTWIMDNGLNSSIMTFYEITDGDLSHTTEFYELPTPILRKALESLVKRGKAQLLEGKGEIGEGVRFLG
ncbi:uncharacterized protein I303_102214 [Kwoniella dejecticola CBS 10117]|uniref:ESCRT-II complex subunit VPS25 n=1 Tax=Kwoniella dejecticola CBS 10117 TaxID=1296121 RepID=A0A1A6ABK5_9TREE|nr:ESCRT-II complex subunit VPS25 [Kwoniella dejecticola CBS 10117]OBR87441.1 ESCRT-II complex subunit VPS25 [Kwoniella dejecticola CBS 10117]